MQASTESSAIDSGNYSHDSERLLIGVMLNPERNNLHLHLMGLIAFEDFFVEQHQVTWKIISALREAGLNADATSVIDRAKVSGEFIGGTVYVVETVNDPIARMCSDESVNAAATRIKGFAMSRKLFRSLTLAITLNNTGQDFDQVSGFLEDELINLKRLSTSSRSGPRPAAVFYDAILAKITAKLDGEYVEPGIGTGFTELDVLMGGELPPEGLVILAGRPGMGKTAFATAIEQNISVAGTPTLFFSLEMTGVSLAQRNLARHSRIPFGDIRAGVIGDRDFGALIESLEVLGRAPCYIDETPGLSMSEIRSRARAFIEEHKKGVIFVDYLQIVDPGRESKFKDAKSSVSDISKGLLQMARELKCPVVALAQLNRGPEMRANKRPIMADLKESGQLEQDASVILFLYRDEEYNPNSMQAGTTEVIFGKNRDGSKKTVRFASDLSRMSYSEMGSFTTQGD